MTEPIPEDEFPPDFVLPDFLTAEATDANRAAFAAEAEATIAQREADAAAEAARAAALAALDQPLTVKPVTGSTVATVKASADAAIRDVALQTEQRLKTLASVLET